MYIGRSGTAHTIDVTLNLSEIKDNSNYKYAYYVYVGSDRGRALQWSSKIEFATSDSREVTISGMTHDLWARELASDATRGTAWVEVVTYNASEKEIASHKDSFEVVMHEDCKPTIGSFCFNPENVGGYNILLTNYNKLGFKIGYTNQSTKGSAWEPTKGSKIVSYTISGPGMKTQTLLTSKGYYTYNHSGGIDVSSSVQSGAGLEYTITVTDERGRSNSLKKKFYNWYHYHKPQITSIATTRYASQYGGTDIDTGTWVSFNFDLVICQITHQGKNINDGYNYTSYIDGELGSAGRTNVGDLKSHTLSLTVTDKLGGQVTEEHIIPAVERIINIRGDGMGIAFGTKSTQLKEFHCAWDIVCDESITSMECVQTGSDIRLKNNIEDLSASIIDNLHPVKYELINASNGKTHFGFIAQEVADVLSNEGFKPEMTGLLGHVTREEQQLYTLAYTEFIPLVVKKCQELQQENNEMRAEIAEIKQLLLQTSSE